MKFFTLLTMATAACAATMHASHSKRHSKRHARRHAKRQCGAGGGAGGAPDAGAPAPIFSEVPTASITPDAPEAAPPAANGDTLVLFEIGGVPGNECLTFRNNGEIVNAACVNEAADRQMTPSTQNGSPVLVVQRAFSAGFRPDLVGVQACVGFNGTHFRAEDCAAGAGVELVAFTGTNVVASGGACLNGHDERAQVTVDVAGNNCAAFTPTVVTPTAP
ncbi:hypothetical protein HYQ45_005043 [Verticillium longisporum]|uniref:Cyanovirin-N domain-containing protein n=1 Tax=Verticillium longisporum TaxID=100787 RepID=A0A0G4NHJ9_VERLO|nr:hypothetical protein HYQ45_005043 [Verticillium longisporum]CRK39394.1 hypothetical protein BN1708_001611 [Verticillium longisporum]CRK45885.1 hypothetical protein BN1723_016602 [Verticillium longisporum]